MSARANVLMISDPPQLSARTGGSDPRDQLVVLFHSSPVVAIPAVVQGASMQVSLALRPTSSGRED